MMRNVFSVLILMVLVASPVFGVNLLSPSDAIIAVDADGWVSYSNYPSAESPSKILDGDSTTKYLNFAGVNSGFIVTPSGMTTGTVQSFVITTANDAEDRDPAEWYLFGTNDAITSEDNSTGEAENWTLIDNGTVSLPSARETVGPVVQVFNFVPYSSYKMVFTSLKDNNSIMQIADVAMYETPGGTGTNVLGTNDPILAVHMTMQSSYPAAEAPEKAIDGISGTKYLNFGKENSGFIVTPSVGTSLVTGLQIQTANDAETRDPASYEIYGTNDAIVSADNSDGNGGESWTLIASGDLSLPSERNTFGDMVPFVNNTFYTSYKVLFPTLKDPNAWECDSMQVDEIVLEGQSASQAINVSPVLGQKAVLTDVSLLWKSPRSENNSSSADPNTASFIVLCDPNLAVLMASSYDNPTEVAYYSDQLLNGTTEQDLVQEFVPNPALAVNTTYYWRVDTRIVSASEPNDVITGAVWSFDTNQRPENAVTSHVLVLPGQTSGTFTVTADDPTGTGLSYQWYLADLTDPVGGAGTALSDGGKYSGTGTASLTVSNPVVGYPAVGGDEGFFYCVVSNIGGSIESNRARLVVGRQVQQYDLEGDLADSVSGYNANLSAAGTDPNWPAGQIGSYAIELYGDKGAIIDLQEYPDKPYPTTGEQFTVTAWVFANTTGDYRAIATNWAEAPGLFWLGIHPNGDLALETQGVGFIGEGADHPFPTGEWQFVASNRRRQPGSSVSDGSR